MMNSLHNSEIQIPAFRYLQGKGIVPTALADPISPLVPESLRVSVVFTDFTETQRALDRAVELAIDLRAETRIIVPHVVPYPLALECPVVPLEFLCSQLQSLAAAAGADPYIHVYLCRDKVELLLKLLPERSIVVIGARKRWLWPVEAERLARRLDKKGFAVVLV